ncbi:structural cement protein Gp24 [Herbaspirillum huttiense]|uniref:Uncharacterized protein n=2 Tax=Herbaspirillum huttiense TaxID=863372 RepID=A0AAJ2LWL7_9BURK|nr:hypothetical protein [Herbaspirillum huttiense]MDR9839450.1 hypothetical protein [Herbaspirillum huttiense]
MGFQKSVNQYLPPAVEGDFASSNPRHAVLASEGQLVAGSAGVIVGRFAWANSSGVVLNSGQGAPTGFVHREQQGLITAWLGEQTMLVPSGMAITLHNGGDFWAKNTVSVATISNPRLKAFASMLDGTMQFAASGSSPSALTLTASTATNVLTVTATSGVIQTGMLVTGAGVLANTYITGQLTGTAGSTGTYSLSTTPGTIASESMAATAYVETNYVLAGFSNGGTGAVGELVKITTGGK